MWIHANEDMWGELWMHEDGKKCEQAERFVMTHRPWANLSADG